MPKVLEVNGFVFRFYSNENNELPHIHVTKGDGNAKYWLVPEIVEAYAYGFTVPQRRDIKQLVEDNNKLLKDKWHAYFEK